MIRAVLFDLDDTLLSLNLTAFIARYVAGASRLLAQAGRRSALSLGVPFARSFLALERAGRTDDLTNRELFDRTFFEASGIPLADPAVADLMDCYEREVVPGFAGGVVAARPQRGNREAVDCVRRLGLTCALATNPTFTLECDRARMRWAGLREEDFAAISTLENSRRCKPCARYYEDFAAGLGLGLDECLMVGNDASRDLARPAGCGLRTAYVGHGRPRGAVWHGSLSELAADLPELVRRLDEQGA